MNDSLLYKYTSSDTAKLILQTSKLRWSSPLLFNDLNEFQQYPTFSPTIEDSWIFLLTKICDFVYDDKSLDSCFITRHSENIIQSIQLLKNTGKSKEYILSKLSSSYIKSTDIEEKLRENIEKDNLNTYRILCLTSEIDNELMWSHYSDNHYGCVLAFKPVKELDSPFFEAKKVDYIEGERIIGSGLDILLNNNMSEIIKKTVHSICFTKNHSWSYEKEWRIMTRRPHSEKDFDDFLFYQEELESITFGVRTSKEDKKVIEQIIKEKYPETIIYQMNHVNGKLIRKPII